MPCQHKPLPSQAHLKSRLDYDPETGVMTWRERGSESHVGRYDVRLAGKVAGTLNHKGYRVVRLTIDGALQGYSSHRLIWMIAYGEDPGENQIDHINGVRDDNRLANIRIATQSENQKNVPAKITNESGYKNVSRRNDSGLYRARITVDGGRVHLGDYATAEEAGSVARKAMIDHYGEFARLD